MEATGFLSLLVSTLVSFLLIVCLPLVMRGKRWKAAEDMAHARRIADAKMNARFLRLSI